MESIKKLGVVLALAVLSLLAAPTMPAEPLGSAVETELAAANDVWRAYYVQPGVFLCILAVCYDGWCCEIIPPA